MRTFVRHLRTRPNIRHTPRPAINLSDASISTPETETLTTHPPSILIPPHSTSEPLTLYRPPSAPIRSALPHRLPPPPPPLPAHLQFQSQTQPQETYPPKPKVPKEPKDQRPKEPKLSIQDIITPVLTPHAYRWHTLPPTSAQLDSADHFFLRHPTKHLWSAAKFKKIEYGNVPEVAFLGRSNVGKSSLLNALLNNKNLAYTSSKPGRTRLMNAFSIADGKLVLLDMPGYGHASREEWGVQIMKYLKSRKQFRRAFLLIDAKHGLKKNDLMLLEQFGREGVSFQIVLSKVDRVKPGDIAKLFEEVKKLMDRGSGGMNAGLGEILATSADPAKKGLKKTGLSELRWAVMVAGGLEGVHFE